MEQQPEGEREREVAVLSAVFTVRLAECEVTLSGTSLTWRRRDSEAVCTPGAASGPRQDAPNAERHCMPVSEIIGVQEVKPVTPTENSGRQSRTHKELHEAHLSAFTVSYVERRNQHHWLTSEVTFYCSSAVTCHQWVQTIQEHLLMLSNRPRRLLVYINPMGGKQRGKQIYEQRVAPLFARASISTHVIVTEGQDQAKEELESRADLTKYDGVVSVGGDGTFSEVIHGLIARTQKDAGIDQNSAEEKLVPCTLRVGIIPAGSTDCICYATTGTNDPVTSALHIIVGDSQPMDVCSVHHSGKFLRYSISLLGYGFYGDVLADSERKRWMGPARYIFSGIQTFLAHRIYEGTVSFLPATNILGSPRDKTRCRARCPVCQHDGRLLPQDRQASRTSEDIAEKAEPEAEWQVVHGKFAAINAATMSCACPHSPEGLSPAAHLADGTIDLILVHNCSYRGFLRHLMRHANIKDQFDMDFVEVHRVRRFRFTPQHSSSLQELEKKQDTNKLLEPTSRGQDTCSSPRISTWTCDGETLDRAAIEVKAHRGLIQLFARGIEDQSAAK